MCWLIGHSVVVAVVLLLSVVRRLASVIVVGRSVCESTRRSDASSECEWLGTKLVKPGVEHVYSKIERLEIWGLDLSTLGW